MRRLRIFRTVGFRLAAFYALLFAVSALGLFAIVRWNVGAAIDAQLRRHVQAELSSLTDAAADAGTIAKLVARREASRGRNSAHYLVLSASGDRLAGDLPRPDPVEGWHRIDLPRAGDDDADDGEHLVEALGERLPGGGFLVVGTDSFELVELQESISRDFLAAAVGIVILAITGGILASRGFLSRIDAIERTSRAIIEGRLSDRIPVRGTGDEIDRLSHDLNTMLDRIEALMGSLRQVSNDIAHDLRTPLGRLRRKLDAARALAPEGSEVQPALQEAIADADGILATFSALLRIAQIESGSRRAGFAPVDLSGLVSEIGSVFLAVAEDAGKRLEVHVAPDLAVEGDRELLAQMTVNLVENAIRHTLPGARIELALRDADGGPVLLVTDNGPGIPPGARARVFERFRRLEESRSTPGHGLGLALVGAVADLHGIALALGDNDPGLRVELRFRGAGAQTPRRV